MTKPIVALVGRPNVGKSTLFNRLAGERLAVVDSVPGTTRDRLVAESEWNGVQFTIVDTGGIDPTDLRRLEPLSIGSANYIEQIRTQAAMAVREADAILLIVDVEYGPNPTDVEVAEILRREGSKAPAGRRPPILLVVNKCDNPGRREQALEFYQLGLGDPLPISAMHGTGIGTLLDRLLESLDVPRSEEMELTDSLRIAIVGRPNVGKSSLLNRLLGEERVIVSPIPGTTRDAIDTQLTYHGQSITLIDTAGIRRRGKIDPGVEKYSVIRTLKAIERSEVALLLIDAIEGVTVQDAHVAGMVVEQWKSMVLLVNKWDSVEKDTYTMLDFQDRIKEAFPFLPYVPTLYVSALTGQRVAKILPMCLQVQEARLRRIPTGQINRVIEKAVDLHAPPSKSGKRLKIYYVSQVRTDPPTFLFHVNDPEILHFSYERFLENRIREEFGFLGTPIRFSFRKRQDRP